jgi:hypothetical protein
MITISLTLPENRLLEVYALLGGASLIAVTGTPSAPVAVAVPAPPAPVPAPAPVAEIPAPVAEAPAPPPPADPKDDEPAQVDSAGVAFDDDLHTGTLKKDGTWRMKKGAVAADAPQVVDTPPPPVVNDDDEFAAFASAPVAPAAPAARKWSDADLSKLCNQGASKDGNPDRVKAIIAKYVPEGEVQHSRNIPDGVREDFTFELEDTIGIQYAG